MPKPPPPPHRIECARILAEIWPRKEVAEALGVSIDTLDKRGVKGTPLEKLKGPRTWQRDLLQDIGNKLQTQYLTDTFEVLQYATATGHGPGKSALLSMLQLWALSTRVDTRIVAVTAGRHIAFWCGASLHCVCVIAKAVSVGIPIPAQAHRLIDVAVAVVVEAIAERVLIRNVRSGRVMLPVALR